MANRETEVKIRISNLRELRNRLKHLGFRPLHPRFLEDNTLFDTPDRALRQVRSILRLRRYGSQWLVTYKTTPEPDPHFKTRVEFESELSHPEAIRAVFRTLGLIPVFRYQKYRSVFAPAARAGSRKLRLEIALDETPIGNFMELEGSRAAIDRTARQLGYSRKDYSTASYGALYREECERKNIPPGDMLFPLRAVRSKKSTARQ